VSYTIALVLFLMWLLGFVSSYTLGGLIHILPVLATVVILIDAISEKRVM